MRRPTRILTLAGAVPLTLLALTACTQPIALPAIPKRRWHRVVDTALGSPDDIAEHPGKGEQINGSSYRATARSVVVLIAK